ncbi:Retrotransposon-like protein 1 [Collichthys lucidus]|uniref:ribonuclease H n=1 Tax=Collichthys lucidus TaxID=240159 RepID=A0A4U5TUK6_COLLU|nr:Retrotransposon-like protein 1 [Collichthys lucidus]
MDPAHTASPELRLERVENILQRHEALFASTAAEVRQATVTQQQAAANQEQTLAALASQIQQLTAVLSQNMVQNLPATAPAAVLQPTPPGPVSEPQIGAPERYAGNPEICNPFITNCSILFALQPHTFASEEAKVAFTINHLTGRARLWGTAEWNVKLLLAAPSETSLLSSGRARQSKWNTEAQCDAYLQGLEEYVKDELVSYDLPATLDELIELTRRVDRRIQARREERRRGRFRHPLPTQFRAVPERNASVIKDTTYVCTVDKTDTSSPGVQQKPGLTSSKACTGGSHSLAVFIDSGANVSIINEELAQQLEIERVPLPQPVPANALDGHLLGTVTHQTVPVQMLLSGNHHETIMFHILDSLRIPLILEYPWLRRHNPHIDWATGAILGWSSACHQVCLKQASAPQSRPCTTLAPDLMGVPPEYHDFREVFSKAKATSLPPHRPYDCAIDLLPGTSPPRGRLYSLSAPERKAMEDYSNDSLAAGIIRPSSSPAGAGFFFVDKKDKSLRPCIDYRGLNDITMKNRYPLPLISSAFEVLEGATIFTKLDLRNAYHLRIREGDEWKTAFNTPTGHYEYLVMPFGLTNAPAVFQALVNDVLRDMLNKHVFVYLDDILIFSKTKEDHIHHVQGVLQRLLENLLFVKAEKCEFHAPSVSFLGYIVGQGSIQMDPAKVSAVTAWPVPDSRKQLQRFLGFANFYRCFIRVYSTVAAPLTALTSSKVPFSWSSAATYAFQTLKNRFTSAPILRMPDPKRQFVVEVDASDVGVGAVLSQLATDDQKLHPCTFFS